MATVRVPWPNPLSSTVGFSIHSLHLTFKVASSTSTVPPPNTDLASSVASAAETFLHEEVIPQEGVSFLDSIHSKFPGALTEGVVPGGLDPFNVESIEDHSSEMEPGGISLFETLIERLLARFEFDAHDVRITLVHPDNIIISLTLSEIKYNANTKQTQFTVEHIVGVTRSLTVNGITLKMKDLRTSIVQTAHLATSTPPGFPVSPYTPRGSTSTESSCSSSYFNDDITSENSQNLPQCPSPSYSMSNIMYHSALSAIDEANEPSTVPGCPASVFRPHRDPYNSMLIPEDLVFSSGTTPITISAVTILPSPAEEHISNQRDKITFSCQTGLFACALRPSHIRGLLCLSSIVLSNFSQSKSRASTSGATMTVARLIPFDVEGSLSFRGVSLLLLPYRSRTSGEDLQQFFLHPSASPLLPSGYLRLQIEGVSAFINVPSQPYSLEQNISTKATSVDCSQMSGTFSIHSLNVFGFRPRDGDNVSAFPILFTDPYLPSQYPSQHLHPNESDRTLNLSLPDFDILDWTDPDHQKKGASQLSYWCCKPKVQQHSRHPVPQTFSTPLPSQVQQLSPAQNVVQHEQYFISAQFHDCAKHKTSSQFVVEGTIMPMHVFLDLGTILGEDTVMDFLDEVSEGFADSEKMAFPSAQDLGYECDDTLSAISRPYEISDQEEKSRQLDLVLEDLDLDHGTTHKDIPDNTLVKVR